MDGRAGEDPAAADGARPPVAMPDPAVVVRAAAERASIEQAAGVVMFVLGCDGEQARAALEEVSRSAGVPLAELARALLADAAAEGAGPVTSEAQAAARRHWSGLVRQRRADQPPRQALPGDQDG